MSKLLQRLQDPSRSGVYRVRSDVELLDALRGGGASLHRISLEGVAGKEDLLDRIARVLKFPDYFGRNWDGLKDCICDLSWLGAGGHVILFQEYADVPAGDREVLMEILKTCAGIWARPPAPLHAEPFFAVFVDQHGRLPLPDLFREG